MKLGKNSSPSKKRPKEDIFWGFELKLNVYFNEGGTKFRGKLW